MVGPDYALVRSRLSQVRKHNGMSLRAVAEATGISAATLSRFESSKGNPDLATLDKLADWLQLSRSEVFQAAREESLGTMGAIEVLLRADPKLDPRTAQALVEGFRIMYERFTQDEPHGTVSRDAD